MPTKTVLDSRWEFIETRRADAKIGFSKGEWLPAQVPGHVHLDLVRNGVIADPFTRMNELGCQWVDETEWSYRCKYWWIPKPGCPRRVLRFEGLDTVCTVLLNGIEIGRSDNMFTPLEIDVTEALLEGENELRVDFQSAVKVGLARQEAYVAEHGVTDFGDRAFVRKAQYMFGWDWGPRLVGCGIWKSVTLLEFKSRILEVHVSRDEHDRYVVSTAIEGEGQLEHKLWSGGEPETRSGDGAFERKGNDWQVLPDLENLLDVVSTTLTSQDGEFLDTFTTTCAISSIVLKREPDSFGESFEFEVNGKPFWARGANWIPDSNFPGAITKTQLRDRLEKARDMGMNMLRVWGGGLYESDDFYDLCDELGILVWQDFPFACGFYPDTGEYVEAFRREAEANIKRLRNHPCLALWCGNNENHQCFADRWWGDRTPPRFYGENFYHGVIPEVLAKLDPAASYTPGSACGPKDSPLERVNEGGVGDSHYWDVWHGRGDWKHYADSTARFSSEFGFCSAPSLDAWRATLEPEDWAVRSPAVRWHDKTGKGYETFIGLVKLHYPEPQTLEDWTYYSQLNQRDALRFGIEHFRRSEFCKGTLVWQINDCWPVQSWAVMDSLGKLKPAGWELQRLYDDLLLSIVRTGDRVQVWAVNDGAAGEEIDVTLTAVHTLKGDRLQSWEATQALEPGARTMLLEVSVQGLPTTETLLLLTSSQGQSTWQLLAEPKDTKLALPTIQATVQDGLIELYAETPVVDLCLWNEGQTAFPFEIHGNCITFDGFADLSCVGLPQRLRARSLAGEHQVVLKLQ